MPSSTANCISHKTGARMRHAGKPLIFPRRSPSRPNPSWLCAWSNGRRLPTCPSAGWWPIQLSGHCPDLRSWLEEQGYSYGLAVPSTEVVCVQTTAGYLLADVARIVQQAVGPQDWQRLSQSQGTKGERLFDWAILPLVHRGLLDHRHFLVVRRCLNDP